MMGSFLNVIVNNTVSGNMRIRLASNKVIIYFAKHNNIGSFVVAKEVLKNIERNNKLVAAFMNGPSTINLDSEEENT